MKQQFTHLRSVVGACLISLFVLHPVWADDTEIYFGQTSQANVILLLDGSGSMRSYDCVLQGTRRDICTDGTPNPTTRLERMIEAVQSLLANAENINLGLMRFGGLHGASVNYPMSDPNESPQIRAEMEAIIDDIDAGGGTPTVGSIEEAWRYLNGLSVESGRIRGGRREARVSHPDTYTGGSVFRESGCVDTNLTDGDCRSERIDRTPDIPVYIAPQGVECNANHIVLLTDGDPGDSQQRTRDQIEDLIGGQCTGHGNRQEECGVDMVRYMHEVENITTHVIGFTVQNDWLEEVAAAGGEPGVNRYFDAESADDLINALSSIVTEVADTTATFVAPSVTIDQFSRLSHREELYLALFSPAESARWNGNLKKYKLTGSVATLKDADNNAAVDPTTGSILDSARSFWSTAADGADVTLGGAAEHLNPVDRNIVSNIALGNNELLSTENTLNSNNLAVGMLGDSSADERDLLIDWLIGYDVADENGNGQTNDARNYIGDPLHSNPVVVTYGAAGGATVDEDNLDTMVYFGTNEGFLHGIDGETGEEAFAYMPRDLLSNVATLFEDDPLASVTERPYGLDGSLTLRLVDHNNNGLIENGDQADGDRAYLYVGMRRGGRNYYALDVSVKGEPKFMWDIRGGEGSFEELGQSWSKPTLSSIGFGRSGASRPVLVFGGGYDIKQDDKEERTSDDDTVGRGIYIVNANTGLVIASATFDGKGFPEADHHLRLDDMKYSIPADPAIVVDPVTGWLSQIYVGDMGGQLWRFDVRSNEGLANLLTGGVIADFGEDKSVSGARRFFNKPDLSLSRFNGELVVNIGIGSGYRAHPLNERIEDKFFRLRYPYEGHGADNYGVEDDVGDYNPAGLQDLHDATGNPLQLGNENEMQTARDELADLEGWFISLQDNGEKILTPASTFNGVIRFTSYSPRAVGLGCAAAAGASFHYAVNLDDGTPFVEEDESRSENTTTDTTVATAEEVKRLVPGNGIAPPISTIFVEHEGEITPTDVSGVNTIREWDNVELTQRWFWAENPD